MCIAGARSAPVGFLLCLCSPKMLERLQKIIARAGISSRRHAEQLILSGQVRVNGEVVTELGTKADPSVDKIEAAGEPSIRPSGIST